MQPLKLTIHGEYWDTQLYQGCLYLFGCDGSLKCLDWEPLIEDWPLPEETRLAMTCAFRRSDYLYGNGWDMFFRDREVRQLIEHKFERLLHIPLELRERDLEKHTLFTRDNPFPFPHTDTTFHYGSLYLGTNSGVFVAGDNNILYGDAQRIWDAPVSSLDSAFRSLALAAGEEGLFRFDLDEFSDARGGYEPNNLSRRHCSECNWVFHNVLGSSHLSGGFLAEQTKTKHRQNPEQAHPAFELEKLIPFNEALGTTAYAWGSKNRICWARDGVLTITDYKPQRGRRTSELAEIRRIELERWKGDAVAGAIASFGAVLELENCIVVVRSDGPVMTIRGEPVNWRVFEKSKHYENQLHIVYDDRLEIYSFNHDYFVDQKSKVTGTIHSEPRFF